MSPTQQAKLRKSLARSIQQRRADASRRGKMGVAARRRKMAEHARTIDYAGTVRYLGAGGWVRQVVIRSDGERVYVDGGPVKTYRAFCAAMNRKLWGLVAA